MADNYTADEVWVDVVALNVERRPDYELYYSYWMALQELAIDPAELNSRFGETLSKFRDNLTRPVVESAESRVRVVEFGPNSGEDATALWRNLDMPKKSRRVHTQAMVKGDGFVIVLPDENGDAGIWPQISDQMALLYSETDPDIKVVGFKYWIETMERNGKSDEDWVRVNLYFEDRIERYISKSAGRVFNKDFDQYETYDDEGDFSTSHSIGEVPVFEFNINYDLDNARGRSDLADATSFIDAINKTFLDQLTASEYTAAPQRWATGVEIPLDPKTGEPVEAFKSGSHKLWTAPNEDASFGQFIPGDLSSYTSSIDSLVEHLAFVTRTPSYSLMKTVQYPSGEALRSAEAPLRSRVSDHQIDFGPVWRDIMNVALDLNDIDVPDEELLDLMPRWLPVNAPYATVELLEELKVYAEVLGVPEEMLWRKAGFTAEEIAEMKEMREEEAVLGEEALAAASAAAILDGAQPEGGLAQDGLIPAEETAPAEIDDAGF